MHSFENDQLCFDNRLNVIQTVFGSNIEFSMRTFLFKTQRSTADLQNQTLSCNLHLDPAGDVQSTQPDNCSCYSEAECSGDSYGDSSGDSSGDASDDASDDETGSEEESCSHSRC